MFSYLHRSSSSSEAASSSSSVMILDRDRVWCLNTPTDSHTRTHTHTHTPLSECLHDSVDETFTHQTEHMDRNSSVGLRALRLLSVSLSGQRQRWPLIGWQVSLKAVYQDIWYSSRYNKLYVSIDSERRATNPRVL